MKMMFSSWRWCLVDDDDVKLINIRVMLNYIHRWRWLVDKSDVDEYEVLIVVDVEYDVLWQNCKYL